MLANTPSRQVGAPLRTARHHAKLTQVQLAAAAGCSLGYVKQLERGLSPTNSRKLSDIWRALDALDDPRPREGGDA